MLEGSISRRYAKALLELAIEQDKVQAWSDALDGLRTRLAGSTELEDVLVNPVYTRDQRRAILGKLVGGQDKELQSLVGLLVDRNRLAYLSGIAGAFRTMADEKLGRLRATVTSASALDDGSLKTIAQKLAAITDKQVVVDRQVDPSILGGVVAQVGSTVFDGSVKTQLEELRRQLKQ
jgi:F-type H+-transporting ATPase subunit delta